MPIALDPSQTVDVVLDLDSEKDEPRPTFVCRHLNCRDVIKVGELTADAAKKDTGNAEANSILNQILSLQIIGWRNIEPAFSPDAFDVVLSPMEKWELVRKASVAVQVDFALKKKSLWQRRSAAENSAKSASEIGSATSQPVATTESTSPASSAGATVP